MSKQTPDAMTVEEVAVRAAMARRTREFKERVADLTDLRPWIQERPLTSCLVAAGAGVALGLLAGGRKTPVAETPAEPTHNGQVHKEHQTLGKMLAASLTPALQPMLRELIHSALGTLGGPGREEGATQVQEPVVSGLAEDNKVVE